MDASIERLLAVKDETIARTDATFEKLLAAKDCLIRAVYLGSGYFYAVSHFCLVYRRRGKFFKRRARSALKEYSKSMSPK